MFNESATMSTPTSVGIGHNSGEARSLDPETLRNELLAGASEIVLRCDELRNGTLRAPSKIDDSDEDTAKKFGDFIKQIGAHLKVIEARRVADKAPFLAAGNVVDGVYKGLADPLTESKKTLERTLATFLRAKEERERARKLEEQRLSREKAEQERKAKEAEEERKRQEANEARLKAEEAQRKADEAREVDSRRAAALQREADRAATLATRVEKQADKTSKEVDRAVARETAETVKENRLEDAKSGKFATTRGDYGSSSTLREYWDFDDLDRETLDLEALRQHLPADALDKAVSSFIRAGGRDLVGVRIFKTDRPIVR